MLVINVYINGFHWIDRSEVNLLASISSDAQVFKIMTLCIYLVAHELHNKFLCMLLIKKAVN